MDKERVSIMMSMSAEEYKEICLDLINSSDWSPDDEGRKTLVAKAQVFATLYQAEINKQAHTA